jgi:hypothetical protein
MMGKPLVCYAAGVASHSMKGSDMCVHHLTQYVGSGHGCSQFGLFQSLSCIKQTKTEISTASRCSTGKPSAAP